MDTEAIDDNERRRLLAVVSESDEAIADAQDSPDPVAVREAVKARMKKGVALQGLGRFGEAVVVWDELLAVSGLRLSVRIKMLAAKAANLHCLTAYEREVAAVDELLRLYDAVGTAGDAELVASTLAGKVAALRRLGRVEELLTATEELVDRFGTIPEAVDAIATALRDTGMLMLCDGYPIDVALVLSEHLRTLIEAAPDESLATCCDAAVVHVSDLLRIGGPSLQGVASSLAIFAAGVATSAARAGHAAAARKWAPLARSVPMADRVERAAAAIGPINRARRRLRQAELVADTVLARIGDSSDERLRKTAARAHLHRAMALFALGEFGAGFREHENLISGNASGAAAEFQRMADINGRQQFLLLRLGQVADLKSRAYALGQGDEAIARVAYDDSIDALPTTDWQSRLVRLVAGWSRSRGGAEIVVPDHLPES